MRWIVLVALLVGCSDESPGGVSLGGAGGAGGAGGQIAAGGGGEAGTTGAGGQAGTGLRIPACAIPVSQMSGTDPAAVEQAPEAGCGNQMLAVTVRGGMLVNFSDLPDWTLANATAGPTVPPGVAQTCDISLRFENNVTKPQCFERLYVHFIMPDPG
jgi:hypothetical protein